MAQTPNEQPTLMLKSKVRMVEVDVIAKDKHGKPVTDLKPEEFLLFDDGKPEKIARSSLAGMQQPSANHARSELAKMTATTVFSNTHAETAVPTVILLDLLNTPRENQSAAKKDLLRALNRLKEGTPIALLILGDDLTVVSDFTTSTISLTQAAEAGFHTRQEGFGAPISMRATGNPTRDALILKATTRAFGAENDDRVFRTLAALKIISQQLGPVHGRKSLLWITAGLSMSGQTRAIEDAIDRLNDANVAVYTVDARGVLLDAGIGADADTNDLTAPIQTEREETRGDVLPVIAASTGGLFYQNSNRLDDAFTHALADRDVVYFLAYYPQHIAWDGKIHRLAVKTTRPGVRLRYRTSHRANVPTPPTQKEQQQALAEIESAPLDYSGIHFSVEIQPGQPADPRFVLHVPVAEVEWFSDGAKMLTQLQVWFIQKLASGEDLATTRSDVDLRLSAPDYQIAASEGISVASDVKTQPTAARVRVMVFDLNSRKIGTVDVPLSSGAGNSSSR